MSLMNMEGKLAAERRIAQTKTSTCSRWKRQFLLFGKHKSALCVIAATWSFTVFAKDVVSPERLVGNCDARDECALHFPSSNVEAKKLCDSPDLSVFWSRGRDRYLVQCRRGNTIEDNENWIIDAKKNFFGKLYFGRFFKKRVLEAELHAKIQDRFSVRGFCHSIDAAKIKESDFVLLDKEPAEGDENPYCYEPVYLIFRKNRFLVETSGGPFENAGAEDAVHPVSKGERRHLNRILEVVRQWHPSPEAR